MVSPLAGTKVAHAIDRAEIAVDISAYSQAACSLVVQATPESSDLSMPARGISYTYPVALITAGTNHIGQWQLVIYTENNFVLQQIYPTDFSGEIPFYLQWDDITASSTNQPLVAVYNNKQGPQLIEGYLYIRNAPDKWGLPAGTYTDVVTISLEIL